MCQSVLQMNGEVVPCRSLLRLRSDELAASNSSEYRKHSQFDDAITSKLGDSFSLPPKATATTLNGRPIHDYDHSVHTPYEDELESPMTVPEADIIDATSKHINQQSVTDLLINAEISLPQGEKLSMVKVIW